MRLDPNYKILGIPVLEVRQLLRQGSQHTWDANLVAHVIDVGIEEAQQLIDELVRRGVIEKFDTTFYKNTIQGNAIANATAAKLIWRKTADRAFAEFMKRVEEVNTHPYYLYRVTKVIVFGSYLSDAEKVSDVDLALDLAAKDSVNGDALDTRIHQAEQGGRRFRNITERVYWPYTEVIRYLKSRSRTLSFHYIDDPILSQGQSRIVFPDPKISLVVLLKRQLMLSIGKLD